MGEVVSLANRLRIVRDADEVALEQVREKDRMRLASARLHTSKQRAKRVQRTASWANWGAMRAFYAEAERLTRLTGIEHEVDHVIPLLGRTVSGLHVETNLRVIPKEQNRAKSNHFADASNMVGRSGIEPLTSTV